MAFQARHELDGTTYTYTDVGNRATVTLPNGTVTAYQYDDLNRLTNLTHQVGTTNLATFSYQLHPTGRRTNAVEVMRLETGDYLTNTLYWEYDGMYRLTNEICVSSLGNTYTNAYEYDLAGNRLKKTRTGAGAATIDYEYNDNDQLTSEDSSVSGLTIYDYDANGSLITKSNATAEITYTYNLANRLSAVMGPGGTTSFLYNDQGIRVQKSGASTTHYLVDANNHTGYAQVLEELATVGGTPTISYVLGDDVLGQCGATTGYPCY